MIPAHMKLFISSKRRMHKVLKCTGLSGSVYPSFASRILKEVWGSFCAMDHYRHNSSPKGKRNTQEICARTPGCCHRHCCCQSGCRCCLPSFLRHLWNNPAICRYFFYCSVTPQAHQCTAEPFRGQQIEGSCCRSQDMGLKYEDTSGGS